LCIMHIEHEESSKDYKTEHEISAKKSSKFKTMFCSRQQLIAQFRTRN